MMNRRQALRGIASISAIAGLAGCTGNESPDGSGDTDNTSTDTPTDTPTPNPTPELARWEQGLQKCSTGDYSLAIRGVEIKENRNQVTVSVKNIGVDQQIIGQVGIIIRTSTGSQESQSYFVDDIPIQGGQSRGIEFEWDYTTPEEVISITIDEDLREEYDLCRES